MGKLFGQRTIDSKKYWKIRKVLYQYLFKYRSAKHVLKDGVKADFVNAISLFRTFKTTLRSLVVAIVISGALFFVNRWISPILVTSGWRVPDDGDYVTFLSAVAGIGGVFIGLYYAALTSVGSAIYAKVPNSIRDLLAKERSGSVYMTYLSTLTLLCVTLIACRVVGLPRMIVAVPFVAILAGVGIVAFVKLGKTAFNLFDPTALSHHIFEDFNKAISITMANGPHWTDPSFQHHAHKVASRCIETLRLLLEITIKETHQNGRPLTQLSCQVLIFLSAYEKFKLKIPSDSHWYPQQHKHRDWYSTAAHSVMVAHRTGTTLQPEMTRSQSWIERPLQTDILRILSITIAQGRHLDVLNLINHLDHYIHTLAINGGLEKAFDFSFEVSDVVIQSIKLQASTESALKDLEKLSIIEGIATLPITIALAVSQHVEHTNIETITDSLTKVNWRAKETLYSIGLPPYLLPQGEWLLTRLTMELFSEGQVISPKWYQKDILNLALAKTLADQISLFSRKSIDFYANISGRFVEYEERWLRACIQSREYEFWHKAEYTQRALGESWDTSTNSRALAGLPWPIVKKNDIENAIVDRKNELILLMAHQAKLLIIDPVESLPDYSGQFFFIIGESFLEALCNNDETLSSSIFQTYMIGCIARFEKLKPAAGVTAGLEESFRTAAACLLDLMELSGYAMLLSELHENKALWEQVQSSWSNLVAGKAGETIKAYLALVVQLNGSGFGLPLRAELRFEWERRIWKQFKKLAVEESGERYGMGTRYRFVHESPLIRSINIKQLDRLPSGYDLFIVAWYINLISPQELQLDWKQEALLKAIKNGRGNGEGLGD
ncbi:hypothetical protein [Pseudomonas putida]|uniref:hypothetical protein n=1 Tax=Pseudomonas putida TaxID=303 RepID=UPI003D964DDB